MLGARQAAAAGVTLASMNFKNYIAEVADFPKPGVGFKDISPLLSNAQVFSEVVLKMGDLLDLSQIDYFAGIESRGFIFAAALAVQFKKGFLPIRKAGKLPPPIRKLKYQLEYGSAEIEMQAGTGRIAILDDVLATGGTLAAAIQLASQAGYTVTDTAVLIDLTFLNQMQFKNQKVKSLIQY